MKQNLDSMILKGIIIAVVTVLMLIPITLITSLIEERAQNKEIVTEDISSKWGGEQNIVGPVLVVPFVDNTPATKKYHSTSDINKVEYAYFLPDVYNVNANVKVEERSRSIYNTLVYQTENKISGYFAKPNFENFKIANENVKWEDAFIMMGVPYMQGIKNKVVLNMNGQMLEATPGIPNNAMIRSGLTMKMPIDSESLKDKYNFELSLNLNGSQKLLISPIGKENNIEMHSDWKTISFAGDFLPTTRDIGNNGFNAKWNVYDYNRNYVQSWIGENREKTPEIGVELKYTVDQYQMSMRSVKYAIMFIALTFVVFFFVEIITKKRIHPVQYILVSFALVIFYTLLIALSEYINFHYAYLISAIAIVAMITLYVKTIFDKLAQTLAMGAFISAIYVYLYVILQLEDMSLLIGAIGLFVALGAIMYASRKIDWYKNKNESKPNNDQFPTDSHQPQEPIIIIEP